MDKNQENPILISKENLEKYGFACFCSDLVPEVTYGYWIRTIDMAVSGTKSKIQNFKIPQHLLLKLSDTKKIVDDKHFIIGSSQSAAEKIKLLSERAGWNQTEEDLQLMIQNGNQGVFIATYKHNGQAIPLGSGISFPVSKDLCWIGMILVHPELRRQGIARRIMQTCLAHARLVQQKSIVGLDATPLGKQVYDSLGFKDSFLIWRSIISTDLEKDNFSEYGIMSFDPEQISDYLIQKNYTERFQVIKLLKSLPESKNIIVQSRDGIHGFVMSRPGRLKPFIGPLIADSPAILRILLKKVLQHWKSKGYDEVFMDIPEQHIGKNSIFENSDILKDSLKEQIPIKPVRLLMRMYQLISNAEIIEYSPDMDATVLIQTVDGYEKTAAFMEKERNVIVPIMYGTSGPEWS